MKITTAVLLAFACAGSTFVAVAAAEPAAPPVQWLPATPEKLPRWRGFNLLEKFNVGKCEPFKEEDFKLIHQLGFNFVRLPMDYRCWIKDKDWEQFNEAQLKEIDQAVEWGRHYGIHVWINFHRAPGYTVAKPKEPTDLFTDTKTQEVCAKHWAEFARRYKGIPNSQLGFNLFNEPGNIETNLYVAVVRKMTEAIRAQDPNRLIISDGMQWGRNPILQLAEIHIAQATRGYSPMEISHYKASWVRGENFPVPVWPRPVSAVGCLLSPTKKEGSHPIVIDGPFAEETALRMHVMKVSTSANVVVLADNKPVWEKKFTCGSGKGEWKKAELVPRYNIYQNTFDKDYAATIPAGTQQVKIRVTAGDWLQISELGFKPASASREDVLPMNAAFGKKPEPFGYAPGGSGRVFRNLKYEDREALWEEHIVPWKDAEAKGVGVMVGEWGAYNKTPHDVVLRWAEDCLANWKKAGWGWALWNFKGGFGILDSERADVPYEDFEGHKLDRKFLELLQRY